MNKKYDVIYADPAWTYNDKASAGKRGSFHKYDLMTLEQLCALPVQSVAADDCLLAMWWLAPMPREALQVMEAWGFSLITMKGFTWHKTTKNGHDHMGMGSWTRANCEDILLAGRGSPTEDVVACHDMLFARRGKPKRLSAGVRQFIEAPVQGHSRKPDDARIRLKQLMGADLYYLELFARAKNPGWDVWGNQVVQSVPLVGLQEVEVSFTGANGEHYTMDAMVNDRGHLTRIIADLEGRGATGIRVTSGGVDVYRDGGFVDVAP